MSPLWISVKTSIAAIIITYIIGIGAAYFVYRIKEYRIKAVVDSIFTLPLVLPPTVAGFYLLYIFGIYQPVGKFILETFHYKIAFSWSGTVLAAVCISFPLMYRSVLSSFEQVNPDLLDAGRTIGMSEMQIFRKILYPNALPGITSGAILAYARGLGEFGATSMLAGNIAGKTQTLPMAIYTQVASGNYENAFAYVYILMAVAILSVMMMNIISDHAKKRG